MGSVLPSQLKSCCSNCTNTAKMDKNIVEFGEPSDVNNQI